MLERCNFIFKRTVIDYGAMIQEEFNHATTLIITPGHSEELLEDHLVREAKERNIPIITRPYKWLDHLVFEEDEDEDSSSDIDV